MSKETIVHLPASGSSSPLAILGLYIRIYGYSCPLVHLLSYTQAGVVIAVGFLLGSTVVVTLVTVLEAHLGLEQEEQCRALELQCRRVDFVLKTLASAFGVVVFSMSLLGISCDVRHLGLGLGLGLVASMCRVTRDTSWMDGLTG